MNEEVIHYKSPSLFKRSIAHIIDAFFVFLFTFILSLFSLSIFSKSGFYRDVENDAIALKNRSGLFIDNVDLLTYLDKKEMLQSDKNDALDKAIISFYKNTEFNKDDTNLKAYENRKIQKIVDNCKLFVEKDGEIIKNHDAKIDESYYYEFYKFEYNKYAINIFYSSSYADLIHLRTGIMLLIIIMILIVGFIIFFLAFPLIFNRNSQTLGMKIFKLGLINQNGFSLTKGEIIFRFLFYFFVEVVLGFLSFFLIDFVSLGFMILGKKKAPLHDLISCTNMVDVENNKIFFDKYEYIKSLGQY